MLHDQFSSSGLIFDCILFLFVENDDDYQNPFKKEEPICLVKAILSSMLLHSVGIVDSRELLRHCQEDLIFRKRVIGWIFADTDRKEEKNETSG